MLNGFREKNAPLTALLFVTAGVLFETAQCLLRASLVIQSYRKHLHVKLLLPKLMQSRALVRSQVGWQRFTLGECPPPPRNVARVPFWPGAICGLSLLLVLVLAQRVSTGLSGFPPSTKKTSPNSNLTRIEDLHENQ